MKANTKPLFIFAFFLALLCMIPAGGCTVSPSIPAVSYMPERIIRDFSDMREDETVARAWIRRGFTLNGCRSITIEPVVDASMNTHPRTARAIETGLNAIFKNRSSERGSLSVSVRTALLDVKTEPGRIRKWFSDIDDFAYIELELVITDTQTGLPLLKLIHFSRDMKSLSAATKHILEDLGMFFDKSV